MEDATPAVGPNPDSTLELKLVSADGSVLESQVGVFVSEGKPLMMSSAMRGDSDPNVMYLQLLEMYGMVTSAILPHLIKIVGGGQVTGEVAALVHDLLHQKICDAFHCQPQKEDQKPSSSGHALH